MFAVSLRVIVVRLCGVFFWVIEAHRKMLHNSVPSCFSSMDIYTKHGTKPRNTKTSRIHARADRQDQSGFRLTRRNSAPLQPV